MHIAPKADRYHSPDGRRGYTIPRFAVVGVSDTGDGPAPSELVAAELHRFRREALDPAGIIGWEVETESTNVYMVKRWIAVGPEHFTRAAALAMEWLDANRGTTDYVHDADLAELENRAA